VKDYNF